MKKLGLCAVALLFLTCGTNVFANSFGFIDAAGGVVENFKVDIVTDAESGEVFVTVANNELSGSDAFISEVTFEFLDPLDIKFLKKESINNGGSAVKFVEEDENVFVAKKFTSKNEDKYAVHSGETAVFRISPTYNPASSDFDNVLAQLSSLKISVQDGGAPNPYTAPISPTPTPEPATMLLLGAGLLGIAGVGRKKLFKRK